MHVLSEQKAELSALPILQPCSELLRVCVASCKAGFSKFGGHALEPVQKYAFGRFPSLSMTVTFITMITTVTPHCRRQGGEEEGRTRRREDSEEEFIRIQRIL